MYIQMSTRLVLILSIPYFIVSVIESSSDVITSSSNDRSTSMSISLLIIDNTLVSEASSSIEPSTISSLYQIYFIL